MSVENSSSLPASGDDPLVSAGLSIAMKWGQALGDPQQLKVAMAGLEPQLKREHEIRMRQLGLQERKAEREAQASREVRQHRLRLTSLIVGAVTSIAMLGAGVYVAKDAWWLATLLCGPSLISMAAIIILRRYDAEAMKAVAQVAKRAIAAGGQQ
ncbi:hypothetical protein ABZZ47_30095 [Streptomyces sp. NPDC006465]|uniref:hypothetical protein n=1 Tax=Streptomyces sp. NPDC006465 TaxID=3157174 RepID=UPI0033BF0BEC